jgi:integrase|tara:strand:+ start:349 stop:1557 length:1209 start_codon:yes stop_codon:yes gene_type:complete
MTCFASIVPMPNGERYVIIDDSSGLPPVLPNMYLASIGNQACRTKLNRARYIALLLNWGNNFNIDPVERIKSAECFNMDEMNSMCHWVRRKIKASENDMYVCESTFKARCAEIMEFFNFLRRRFSEKRRDNRSYTEHVEQQLYDLYDTLTNHASRGYPKMRTGYSHAEVQALLSLVDPLNPNNPFQMRVRERNHLIITLFLETGIRLGELLSLRTDACFMENDIEFGMKYFLVVSQNVYLDEDPRAMPPDAKTTSRYLPISEGLAKQIDHYIMNGRRYRKREAQRAPAFLFLNSAKSPKPLSTSGLHKFMKRIERVGNLGKNTFSSIEPHRFRYTFIENLARALNLKSESEEFKKIMRYVGGWSKTSDQYKLYANKEIVFKSHLALQKLNEDSILMMSAKKH